MINLFPYTDTHELNLDWVVEQVKANNTKVKDLTHTVENLHFDFDSKADKATTYTKSEVDTLLLTKADVTEFNNYYNKGETDSLLAGKADISSLASVATSGNYNDLNNKPTIPAAQVNSDWDAVSGVAQILNKPTLASVATSGSYNDLLDKPLEIKTVTKSLTTNNDGAFNMLNEGNFNVLRMYINNENTVKVIDYLTYGNTLYAVPKNEARTQTFPNTTFSVTIISIA